MENEIIYGQAHCHTSGNRAWYVDYQDGERIGRIWFGKGVKGRVTAEAFCLLSHDEKEAHRLITA